MNQSQPGHQAPLYHVNAHPSMQMLYHHHPHMQVPVYYQVLNLANNSGLFQGCFFFSFFLVNKVWAENFRMVDIEINAWSSLFYIETNLVLYLLPIKCIKLNQSESRILSR